MKIGVLTVPFNNNYGGYLQSYALMTVLKQMGHEPTLIMRRHNIQAVSVVYRIKFFVKGIIKSIICCKKQPCIYNKEISFKTRGKNMFSFVEKYIQPQTKYIYSTEELSKECRGKYHAYVVGSDQVWRAIYVSSIIGNMYLDFTEGWNVKRLVYAASFGTDTPEYTDDEKKLCGKLIENFDAVSVRENSGLKVFDKFKWKVNNPKVVLDPTLLLMKEDYNQILPQENKHVKGKIFCYVLDKDNEAKIAILNIQHQLNKPLYEITDIQKGDSVLPSIETWLTAIRDSDFVITDSFHGAVFSIIFNKPFAVYVNKARGVARLISLLEQFSLEKRIICDYNSINNIIKDNIDWETVKKMISKRSRFSKQFLYDMLK